MSLPPAHGDAQRVPALSLEQQLLIDNCWAPLMAWSAELIDGPVTAAARGAWAFCARDVAGHLPERAQVRITGQDAFVHGILILYGVQICKLEIQQSSSQLATTLVLLLTKFHPLLLLLPCFLTPGTTEGPGAL